MRMVICTKSFLYWFCILVLFLCVILSVDWNTVHRIWSRFVAVQIFVLQKLRRSITAKLSFSVHSTKNVYINLLSYNKLLNFYYLQRSSVSILLQDRPAELPYNDTMLDILDSSCSRNRFDYSFCSSTGDQFQDTTYKTYVSMSILYFM